MAVNDTITSLVKTMEKGAGFFVPQAVSRYVSNTFAGTLAAAANDVITAIKFDQPTWVLHAWVYVNTVATAAAKIDLGKADGAELMAATLVNAAGVAWTTPSTFVPVLFAAADTLDAHFTDQAGTGGNFTVIAQVVDAAPLDGNDES